MTTIPYRIVVMSRKRTHHMPRIAELLPTATVFVEESEEESYRNVGVHQNRLAVHPPAKSMGDLRNMVLDQFKEEAIVSIDDDFKGVTCLVGRRTRRVEDAGEILQIIENSVNVANDAGIEMFGWQRDPNPMSFRGHDPFGWVGPACGGYGVIGRKHRFDDSLVLGEDVDFTMQVLRDSRLVWLDKRFYFDFGEVFTGVGGLQGIRTSVKEEEDRKKLSARWKGHLNLNGNKERGSKTLSIRVQRKSPVTSTKDGGIR